jgi:hypothetical protein
MRFGIMASKSAPFSLILAGGRGVGVDVGVAVGIGVVVGVAVLVRRAKRVGRGVNVGVGVHVAASTSVVTAAVGAGGACAGARIDVITITIIPPMTATSRSASTSRVIFCVLLRVRIVIPQASRTINQPNEDSI